MTRKEFAKFIDKLKEAENRGDDLDAIVKEYENENVYVYNDACFKKIFASEKNTALSTRSIAGPISASLRTTPYSGYCKTR